MGKPYRYSCPRCERTDSICWRATAWWSDSLQRFQLSEHLEGAYCEHCGPLAGRRLEQTAIGDVEPVQLIMPDADDWAEAVSFEIRHVALIEARDRSGTDWKTCDGLNPHAEVQDGETLIRSAFGVYWLCDEGLATHIEDFDDLIDAQAFADGIANGREVDDWAGDRHAQKEQV